MEKSDYPLCIIISIIPIFFLFLTTSSFSYYNNYQISQKAPEWLTHNPDAPGWPERPRRTLTISEGKGSRRPFKIGYENAYKGLEFNMSKQFIFSFNWNIGLTLIKTCKRGLDGFFKNNANEKNKDKNKDKLELNYKEGIDFVGVCALTSSISHSSTFELSASFWGSGIGKEWYKKSDLEIQQETIFFRVNSGDTVEDIFNKCKETFISEVQDSIIEDFKILTYNKKIIFKDTKNVNLKRGIIAAVNGPALYRLKINKHHWNIYPADVKKEDDKIIIKGKLDRQIRFFRNTQVNYYAEFKNGMIIKKSISDSKGKWFKDAVTLIDTLIDEIYMFHLVK